MEGGVSREEGAAPEGRRRVVGRSGPARELVIGEEAIPLPERTVSGIAAPDTAPDDPRVGRLLGSEVDERHGPRAVLLGFPSDEGVRRNGGRPGAAGGPGAIRRQLYRLTPEVGRFDAHAGFLARTADLGDLVLSGNLEEDQARLASALAPLLARGVWPIVLGGGHETAYGHFLGYVEAGTDVSILSWDAHPDVRPLKDGKAHSGSPFRQALEHPSGRCRSYAVAGLLPHAAAAAHLRWMEERGGRAVWGPELTPERLERLFGGLEAPAMVSFDLDAVDQSEAPGVSAPAVGGLNSGFWLWAAYRAGTDRTVRSVDVVELNPAVDRDDQTARLAALTVWQVTRGMAVRPTG